MDVYSTAVITTLAIGLAAVLSIKDAIRTDRQVTSLQLRTDAVCRDLQTVRSQTDGDTTRLERIAEYIEWAEAHHEADRRTIVELRAELERERAKKGEASAATAAPHN